MSKQLIYVIGKMRGVPFYNFPAFDAAARMLRGKGHEVLSPADMDRVEAGFEALDLPPDTDWSEIPAGFSFESCVTRDIEAVRKCDAIYALRGWEKSKGARAEHALAEWLGKDIMYQCEPRQDNSGIFPTDAQERKTYPVFTGVLQYFPNAIAHISHLSYTGNEQHNAGEPMHWARDKSIGDGNQIVRHLMEGELTAMAWRALELLERSLTDKT